MQAIAVICQAVLVGKERQDINYSIDELGIDLNGNGNELTQDKSERIMGVLIRDYLRILKEKYNAKNGYKLFLGNVYTDLRNYNNITHNKPQKDLLYVLEWLNKKNTISTYCKGITKWIKSLEIDKLFSNLFGNNMENMDGAPPISINLNNNQQNQQLIKENKVIFKKIEHPNWYLGNKNQTIGLDNVGATCYMNATLQCLAHVKPLSEWILKNKDRLQESEMKNTLIYDYSKVLEKLWYIKNGADGKPSEKSFPPNSFKQKISDLNPLFAGVQANDSKDLINFMLETLHNELNQHRENSNSQNAIINQVNEKEVLDAFRQEYYSKNQSSIVDNFYGITETTSLCLGCKTAKYNFQIYSFLEFPLLEAKKYTLASRTQNPKWLQLTGAPTQDNIFKQTWDNYTLTLEDCLEYYRKIDLMNGQNQMYCNICNGNQDACYGTKIYSAPETLIINLNRGKGAVHQIPIQIPATLNLRNYITDKKNDGEYYLSGIVTHFGPSNMGGHFIAHYRDNALDDSWVKYNDGIVTPNLSTQKVLTIGMPYILFYSKKKPMKPLQNRINTPYSQGLNNIGFTCYMNSAVQLLSHIKPISEYILQLKENNRLSKNLHPIAYQYANLLEEIWFGNKAFRPEEFQRTMEDYGSKNRYDFKLWKTNDACDLFRCLIDGLHAELNVAPNPGGNVPVQSNQTNLEHVRKAVVENYLSTDNSIFTNEILTSSSLQTRCKNKNCNCITYNYQFFNITDFFMNDTKYTKAQKLSINPEQVRELNIKDCVKDYEKVSLLPESMCSICRNSGTSQMSKLDIVGRNWVVCLDYGKNKELYTGGFKLDENIDLRKIFKQTANKNGKYYLSGIVIHIGSGQELGHYITYCRMGNEDNTPWYKYDDGAKASKTDFKTIADSLLYSNHFAPRMLVYTAVPDVKGQVNANQSQPQQQILNNIKEQKFNKIKNEVEQKYNVNRVDNTKGLLNPKSKSCYINSVLQCLIHIKPLTTKLLADRIQQKLNPLDNDAKNLINSENEKAKNTIIQRQVSEKLVLRAYTDLLTDVYSRTGNTYSDPTTLINLLNRVNNIYDLNNAGDAYDVLTQFLPIIENETLVKNKNPINLKLDKTDEKKVLETYLKTMDTSTSTDVFARIARKKIYCTNCKNLTYSFENPLFLNVPLKDIMFKLNHPLATQYARNPKGLFENTKNSVVTLAQGLEYNSLINDFFGDNAMYCDFCKKLTHTQMNDEIYTSPNVLVVAMKNGDDITGRVAAKLSFPSEFDFASTNYILLKNQNNEKYFLSGIVFHMGESGSQGHYVAVCRDAPNASWYLYNDNKAIKIDYSDTRNYGFPCLLFYQKFNWTLK